jgi:hypothetical protein
MYGWNAPQQQSKFDASLSQYLNAVVCSVAKSIEMPSRQPPLRHLRLANGASCALHV